MIATAEPDAQVDDVIDSGLNVEQTTTAVSKIECPVGLPVVNDLRAKYGELVILGIDDKAGFSTVDEARKHCKRVRIQVESWRKDQNEEALKHQRRVNAAAKMIREPLEVLEESLACKQKVITDEVERIKREAEEKLRQEKAAKLKDRMDALLPLGYYDSPDIVAVMSDDTFAEFLSRKQSAHHQKLEAEAAEKKRLGEEAELQRLENERLSEERKKLEEEKAELENLRRELAEREAESQRKIDEETNRQEKAQQERLAAIERERLETERKERERLESEEQAKREEAARLRSEQLRPDREKLLDFSDQIRSLPIPEITTDGNVTSLVAFALAVAADKIADIAKNKLT